MVFLTTESQNDNRTKVDFVNIVTNIFYAV